jgi:hypothetical protein
MPESSEYQVRFEVLDSNGNARWITIFVFANPGDTIEDINNRILDDIENYLALQGNPTLPAGSGETINDAFGNPVYDVFSISVGAETFYF